jgi:hypothetical protein
MTELSSCVIETLWEDEEFVLSRCVSDREPSPRLAQTPASAGPALESVARLEQAYTLCNELDSAWAARPLALEQHEGRPVLFVEDPGGEARARFYARFTRAAVLPSKAPHKSRQLRRAKDAACGIHSEHR